MKQRNNEGSSLIEILIAIAVLAVIVIPVCSSLVLSHRLNAKTETMLQAQLEVSSAVETLMAKGIPANYNELTAEPAATPEELWWLTLNEQLPKVNITVTQTDADTPYYNVTVTSDTDEDVTVTTMVRMVAKTSDETTPDLEEEVGQ